MPDLPASKQRYGPLAAELCALHGGDVAHWQAWLRTTGLPSGQGMAQLSPHQRSQLQQALRLRPLPKPVTTQVPTIPPDLPSWARAATLAWLRVAHPTVLGDTQHFTNAEAQLRTTPLPVESAVWEAMQRDPAARGVPEAGLRVWALLEAMARDLRLHQTLQWVMQPGSGTSQGPARALPLRTAVAIAAPDARGVPALPEARLEVLQRRDGAWVRLRSQRHLDSAVTKPTSPDPLAGLLQRVPPLPEGRIALQLPAATTQSLHELALRWRHQAGRSGGLVALLAGLAGHGRRTAARELAEKLALPLLRVQAAMLGSRWIGEAEARVSALFATAAKAGAALLIEDADDLLGPRVAVSTAGDRYSNTLRNHLLQEVEQFRGLTLLVAAGPHRFDAAMQRRIGVTVRFSVADQAQRAQILAAAWAWLLARDPALQPIEEPDFKRLAAADLSPQALVHAVLDAGLHASWGRATLDDQHLALSVQRQREAAGAIGAYPVGHAW